MKKLFLFIPVTVACLLACKGNKVYDDFQHTNLSGWEKNDHIVFEIPPVSESGTYESVLSMRITHEFPFKSVTLIVTQSVYPEERIVADTLKCDLIGDNGLPMGRGVSYYQYDFPVGKQHLNKGDSVSISVRHDMKREILPGISDVGISLSR